VNTGRGAESGVRVPNLLLSFFASSAYLYHFVASCDFVASRDLSVGTFDPRGGTS
jgi:hypothetical protein